MKYTCIANRTTFSSISLPPNNIIMALSLINKDEASPPVNKDEVLSPIKTLKMQTSVLIIGHERPHVCWKQVLPCIQVHASFKARARSTVPCTCTATMRTAEKRTQRNHMPAMVPHARSGSAHAQRTCACSRTLHAQRFCTQQNRTHSNFACTAVPCTQWNRTRSTVLAQRISIRTNKRTEQLFRYPKI